MSHYQENEWRLYSQELLAEEERALLEEHLENCGQCLEKFLALITEEEIDSAKQRISPDFTDSVLNLVQKEQIRNLKPRSKANYSRRNIFVYYLAVSAITIILMGSGFFQTLVDKLPQLEPNPLKQEQQTKDINLDWSRKVTNKAANWIQNFETQD